MSKEGGFAIWLTGLPASGKTTLAVELASALRVRGVQVQILDSDELREVLTPEPTFSRQERDWFYETMVFIGQLLTRNGVNVVFAATASRRHYRAAARQAIPRFAEVYVRCSLETCMARDRKGVYAKGLSGESTTVPGLQVPYEPPVAPELTVDTENQSPREGVSRILDWLSMYVLLCD